MISHLRKKHGGLKFLVLDEKSKSLRLLWTDKKNKKTPAIPHFDDIKVFHVWPLFHFKKCFYCNQLKFQNKVTLNKKLKQVVFISIFFPDRRNSSNWLPFCEAFQLRWISLFQTEINVLTRYSCPALVPEIVNFLDKRTQWRAVQRTEDWGQYKAEKSQKKGNIHLEELDPRVTMISAFP